MTYLFPGAGKDKILSPNGVEEFDREEPGGTWTCDLSVPCERMVANELVDLAWVEEGENWMDEVSTQATSPLRVASSRTFLTECLRLQTMDGKEFELPEPPPGETWTRDDYKLPEEGIMQVTYLSSKRAPKKSDAMDEATCTALRLLIERFAEVRLRPPFLTHFWPISLTNQAPACIDAEPTPAGDPDPAAPAMPGGQADPRALLAVRGGHAYRVCRLRRR